MEHYEINEFKLELRKINAIKIDCLQKKSTEEKVSKKTESEKEKETCPSNISIALKQEKDIEKIELFVYYRIPSITNFNLEIDAEFYGLISLNESIDIDKIDADSTRFKDFMENVIVPKVKKELDKNLIPVFRSMNVKYDSLFEKLGDESIEV